MKEAEQARDFFVKVGLPFHLEQLGFDPRKRKEELDQIILCSLGVFFLGNEPFEVTYDLLQQGLIDMPWGHL